MLNFVGPPIQNSFMTYYGCSKEDAQKAADVFREYYKTQALLKAVLYDGIYQLCDELKQKGKKMAVATYKREDYALTILKHFGLDKYFTSMHGADNNNVLTKADIVDLCIKEIGGDRGKTVLIGDTCYDAIGAENAKVSFIAVTYGFGFKKNEVLNFPNIGIADTPMDVIKYI
jgi:phosphoglycolate phosphatase